jgi:glyoxylase-like metal-dependent hydrolase (beta-lactamase superfamily II)
VKQGGEITSGVRYIAAPGHSPSHASILFSSGKEQFMHMGDIAHNPVTSLQHPEWTPIFDYDPAGAINSRKAILDRVATDGIMGDGLSFSVPWDRPRRQTRQGISLGSRPLGMVASG